VDELVDAETLESTAPTASRWADGLEQLLQYADRLSTYASTIPDLPLTPSCKRVLQRAHERAETALRKLPGPTLDGYERDFDVFVEGYEATLIDPECQDTTLGPSGATDTIYAYDVGSPVAPTVPEAPAAPVSADLAGTNGKAVALTVLGVVALVTLMLTTVAMATWAPKPTFGTGADYWAVFAAAFASSAGAAVFALLRLWAVTDDE
jgi:hypothetical protein